jgi:acyl-CoA synthetase (AMP-forming)/AMP-acid ligase II
VTTRQVRFHPRDTASWIEIVEARAESTPGVTVYTELTTDNERGRSYDYATLAARARAIAAYLQQQDAVGQRAILLYPGGLDFIEAFLGCLMAGLVAVPTHIPMNDRVLGRTMAVINDCRASYVLSSSRTAAAVDALVARAPEHITFPPQILTDAIASDGGARWTRPVVSRETLAFLQYTSGSTGDPKGVMVTNGNLLHNSECLRHSFDLGPDDVSVTWLPVFHDMGLILGVLQPLYTGFHAFLMEPIDFLRKPIRWLRAISRYRATHAGGPNFSYAVLTRKVTDQEVATLDLSSWRTAFNGAEPVRLTTLDSFTQKFAPAGFRAKQHLPCYGLAEATLIVSGADPDGEPVTMCLDGDALGAHTALPTDSEEGVVVVSSGKATIDADVRIVDFDTREELPKRRVGEIWVRSPSVAVGYWEREDATRETLKAVTASGEGPFLRTGDLGFIDGEELYVTGRLKDVIIIRGRNHYPQDIEGTAEASHNAIRGGCTAAFSIDEGGEERLVVVTEVERRREPRETPGTIEAMATHLDSFHAVDDAPVMGHVASAVRKAVLEMHQLRVDHVVLLKATSIPKTSSGKIQRRLTRMAWQGSKLDPLYAD